MSFFLPPTTRYSSSGSSGGLGHEEGLHEMTLESQQERMEVGEDKDNAFFCCVFVGNFSTCAQNRKSKQLFKMLLY